MSRKSLLLIAAAVISAPALVSTNAFAKGAAAAHSAVSRPHVSTLGAVGRVAVPRAKVYGTPGPGSKKNASGSNPTMVQKALDAARAQQQKALQDAAKTSNPTMVQKALDAARAQQEKALQDAKASNPTMFQKALDAARAQQKAAEDAIRARAKGSAIRQTPADPEHKVGSQIPTSPPPPPSHPGDNSGDKHWPRFPGSGGVVVMGGPDVVVPDPVVVTSTVPARVAATSRVVAAGTDGASAPRPTGPCNCLVKERLQDGSILFMDICTKESAVSAPTNGTATRDAQ